MSENIPRRSPLRMVVLLVLHAVCGMAILALLLMHVPKYECIFKDFGVKLPELTILIISLSRLFASYWYVLVPGLGMTDIVVLFALNRAGQVGLLTAWGVLVWLAEMLLMGLIVVAVLVPMNDITIRLSQ